MALRIDPRLADLGFLRIAGVSARRKKQAAALAQTVEPAWYAEVPPAFFTDLALLYAELGDEHGMDMPPQRDLLLRNLRLNKYMPQFPTPKQAYALLLPHLEVFFGGSAGPGKSSWLLMSALQYIDIPGYAAILFRRTFAELSKPDALMERGHTWLRHTDAHWNANRHTYTFPSGAQLVFSHLENASSIYEHQSAAYQFCVAGGTPVLLANGDYAAVETLMPGMSVATLQGPRPITYCAPPRHAFCYALHTAGIWTVVGASHRILTTSGWHAPLMENATQFQQAGTTSVTCRESPASDRLRAHSRWLDHWQAVAPAFQAQQAVRPVGNGAFGANAQTGYAVSENGRRAARQPQPWSVPAMLYVPALPPIVQGNASWYRQHAAGRVHCEKVHRSNLSTDYHGAHDWHDARFPLGLVDGPESIPLRGDAEGYFHRQWQRGDREHIREYTHGLYEYSHPYTKSLVQTDSQLACADIEMVPVGEQVVYDLRVAEASHYISFGGIISQNCGFDETTSFSEHMYRFLFSRLRRLAGSTLPIRMRGASNPGGLGHTWVRQRFMVEQDINRAFVPARQLDNPYLDVESYEHSLAQLDPVTRQRLRAGDWDITEEGKLFKAHWFGIVPDWPRTARTLRFWDFAGTEEKVAQGGVALNDPDWTVGLRLAEHRGQYWVIDIRRERLTPKGVEDLVLQTAQIDGRGVDIWLEQEPGSSGKAVVEDYQRRVLKGYAVYGLRSTGSKVERAKPASSAAEAGNLFLLEGRWNREFLEELGLFPNSAHDDQVDALSGAVNILGDPGKKAGTWGR